MAWTKIIGQDEADGDLKGIYEQMKAKSAIVQAEAVTVYTQEPNLFRWLSEGLQLPGSGYGVTAIDRMLVNLIVVAVSAINECGNCVTAHTQVLRQLVKDDSLVDQVIEDYTGADLDSKTMAALDYAAKVTRSPSSVEESDISCLREAGYSDQEIVDIAHVTAWFNYVNRVALGLGTQLRR